MQFQHSREIWRDFPELVPGIMYVEGITADVPVAARTAMFTATPSRWPSRSRWPSNRQSGRSAVRDSTTAALIVAEAMHATASADVKELSAAVAEELAAVWSATPAVSVLSPSSPGYAFRTREEPGTDP